MNVGRKLLRFYDERIGEARTLVALIPLFEKQKEQLEVALNGGGFSAETVVKSKEIKKVGAKPVVEDREPLFCKTCGKKVIPEPLFGTINLGKCPDCGHILKLR